MWNTAARFPQFMEPFCKNMLGLLHPIPTVAHIRIGDTRSDTRGILRRSDG